MSWRFYLRDVPGGAWVDNDLPLEEAEVSTAVSGPASIRGTLPPSYPLKSSLKEWGSMVIAQYGEQEPVACIIDGLTTSEDGSLEVEAGGFSQYPDGQPWVGTEFSSTSVDPMDIVRRVWAHLQSLPEGNLGVVVAPTTSSVRLGVPQSAERTRLVNGVNAANDRLKAATNASVAAAKAQLDAKNALLALVRRPKNGQVFRQDTAPSGARRATVNFWIDSNNGNKGYIWNGKAWVLQTFTSQANINSGWSTYQAKVNAAAAAAKVVTTRKSELSKAKSNLSSLSGGQAAPYTLNWWDSHDLGSIVSTLAEETPFEYREKASWTDSNKTSLALYLELGVPSLGSRREDLKFEVGVNITAVPQRQENEFSSEVMVLGAGEGRAMIRAVSTATRGRLRRATVAAHKEITKTTAAANTARTLLGLSNTSWSVRSLEVWDTPFARVGSFKPGDQIYIQGSTGWSDFDSWVRVTRITTDCETSDIELEIG